ncbi:FAD-dependent monooxygenase [Streptomyces sp. H39-S7]|uniref:FAD-dependent monooxygenase n=1 Tax=Streptomyces sp. H39-S7 TaxID=3004357 RepID=UPI0022AFA9DC|nr:FAD-dependent monooxygenase [Streptomyces sp. H39-S7]MCZ4125822.1 FAD-dependent monooxygenase [Streptomyces sp. H39-S7]
MATPHDFDVIIAGGGPVGVFLSAELRLAGIRSVVVERLAERSPHSKAFGLHSRSMEVLDRRNLIDRFTEGARSWSNGHFAGQDVWIDFSVLDSSHAYALLVQQTRTEELLEEHAVRSGVDIRRSHEITGVEQDEDGVTVQVTGGGAEYALRGRYLVGCDGGRSLVRKAAGIPFPGQGGRVTARLADVVLADGENAPMGMERTENGLLFCVSLEEGVHRVATFDYTEEGRKSPDEVLTLEEFQNSMRKIWGTDLGAHDARWLSWFTDSARQAETYRQGRILLAGDAAHTHFPVGGQGLNLGLQDAFNLGWKLAAEINGWAPEGLLDSYNAERRPPAEGVIANTLAQIALMNPDPIVTPLRDMFNQLMQLPDVNRFLAGMIAGVDVRYPPQDGTHHRLVGDFARDMVLKGAEGDVHLAHLLYDGKPVLIDLAGQPETAATLARWAAAAGAGDRVRSFTGTADATPDLAALLIRPDGYVAWAADRDATPEELVDGLHLALSTWFGQPAA